MAKTRAQKESAMTDLAAGLVGAKGIVFANFQGLSIKETDEIRTQCKKEGIMYMSSKKTLLKKALESAGIAVDVKAFGGGVAVVAGKTDEVAPAKIVATFAKTHTAMSIFGGVLDGVVIDAAKVTELSKLPSKQDLYGMLVRTINGPMTGFANVLAGNIRGLVTVLSAVKDKKPA